MLSPSSATGNDLSSHIAVKFEGADVQICSILGCKKLAYPADLRTPVGRLDLQARWDAWQPIVTAGAALGTMIVLLAFWLLLGFVSSLVVWPLAWIRKKDLAWFGAWRVGSLSLSIGTLFAVLALWAYGFGLLDLLQFLIAALLQFLIWMVSLAFAFCALPARAPSPVAPGNPFASSTEAAAASGSPFSS